jgi:two-component system, sensor histidine kinase and response regulator
MTDQTEPQTIVVIDDDRAIRLSCQKILSKSGFNVETFDNGAHGLEAVARLKPALVVVDLKMPGISGTEVISRIHESDPGIVIIVITGYATIDTAVGAMKLGAYDFLPKPFSPEELRLIVNRGLERRQLALDSHRTEMEREILKHRFITFVSHQLQTPLVAIHQYLDVLNHLGDTDAAKRHEWIDRSLKRTEQLQAIIKDWLTLAKVEGGFYSRQRAKVDLRQTVTAIINTYEDSAAAEGVTLEDRLPEDGCPVVGDPNCLSVLFDNLIVNAIKYNKPNGKVTVSADRTADEVVVSVSDTGVGIPEKYRQMLFNEFFRIEELKKTTGTGLGLAICKRIVSELGGRISLESEVNVGSTFRVQLLAWQDPVKAEQEEGEKQKDAISNDTT